MRFELDSGQVFNVDTDTFSRVAHFKTFHQGGVLEFVDNSKNVFWIKERVCLSNRFVLLHFSRPNSTVQKWSVSLRMIQCDGFHVRYHTDEIDEVMKLSVKAEGIVVVETVTDPNAEKPGTVDPEDVF